MKIALILFGITYADVIKHWAKNNLYKIDYLQSYNNYKENILNSYPKSKIDIFLSTYKSQKTKNLIKDYKPKAYNLFEKLEYTKKK